MEINHSAYTIAEIISGFARKDMEKRDTPHIFPT